nr:glycosyltransferase family 4 protein [Marinobacter halophilus]
MANTGWYLNNFRRSTLEEFVFRGHDVSVLCPRHSGEDLLSDVTVAIQTFELDNVGTSIFSELRSLFEIYFRLKQLEPDFVFSFNPKTNLYSLLSCEILGVPCVPNVSGVGNASQLVGLKAIIYKFLSRFSYKTAKKIFFQNEEDQHAFYELGVLESLSYEILPGSGVDLSRFQPTLPRPSRPFRFLLACRLIRQKGVLEYLQAAELVDRTTGRSVEFWLAGVPDNSARAVSNAEIDEYVDKGIIRFLGQVQDIASIMPEIDCVVLPSYYPEGVPRVLLEGAASGKVLITTDRPGCRNVVTEGANGFFVTPGSVDSLLSIFDRVLSLTDSDLQEMGKSSRELAECRFDERLVIDAYLNSVSTITGITHC